MKKFFALLLAAMMLLGSVAMAEDVTGSDRAIIPVEKTSIPLTYTTATPVGDTLSFIVSVPTGVTNPTVEPALTKPLCTIGTPDASDPYRFTYITQEGGNNIPLDVVSDIADLLANVENGSYFRYTITEQSTGDTFVTAVKGAVDVVVYKIVDPQDKTNSIYGISLYQSATGTKAGEFQNAYAIHGAKVKKELYGNAVNENDYETEFAVRVTFENATSKNMVNMSNIPYTVTAKDGTRSETRYVTITPNLASGAKTSTTALSIKGDEVISFDVPAGIRVHFEEEAPANGWVTDSYVDTETVVEDTDEKSVLANESKSAMVTITNKLNQDIPTGIYTDALPYILLIAVAVLGVAGLIVKRRLAAREDD